ncbi:DEAD/DEAH box helicase [Methanogenium marinum]|uniref:DEAD/DEAH box helicase n=1 Tax=Methanogenium marinum TaxID=348610 RepID=A0A9Q4KSV0_9EURY|nr:DEAD/DEAH box helicase [Methanogenium marinum]MDE4908044.1 DEAD/DEAH box helicase [Methanogenium marinum]
MSIIVNPRRGPYRLYFYDGRRVTGIGDLDLSKTGKGCRPKEFRYREAGRRQPRHVPTKDLIRLFRKEKVYLTGEDEAFRSMCSDLQIPVVVIRLCRICLLGDRVTLLKTKNAVKYGREEICVGCAKNELRREAGYLGGMGMKSIGHLEHMLEMYRDLDRVLGMLQPDTGKPAQTLFDKLEAHAVMKTQPITDLPLPKNFVEASGVKYLMPVQQLCVEAGLLKGKDQLVVAATASGKTFIGEMAGVKNLSESRGSTFFLVPLVALANQKYRRFSERYGDFMNVSLLTGVSRIHLPGNRENARRSMKSDIIVGTYEGVDHHLRMGKHLAKVGTVVIDEVQMLEDADRGHRLDGLIARLRHVAPKAQFLFLSATIGSPSLLAKKLNAELVRYDERPVGLERHLIFTERKEKIPIIRKMVAEEFKKTSSKGFHGQTIVFTNSRARCHMVAEAVGSGAMPYHAGLSPQDRRKVEKMFEKGEIAAVITTAALAAGVDFPASQVIFDALAMGISWLKVQEFSQMMGRAGRPDFHDLGKVVILAEPGGVYSRESGTGTEEEVAMRLLKGEMEEVAPVYDIEGSSEEYAANAVVCGGDIGCLSVICETMVGELEDVGPLMKHDGYVYERKGKIVLSPLGQVMAEHFIGVERLSRILKMVRKTKDPLEIVAELDCVEDQDA